MLDRSSGGTASMARERLSDVSSRDLAKEDMAKVRAFSTSRLAIRRMFSCSARERRSWSLRSFSWVSSSSSLDGVFVVDSVSSIVLSSVFDCVSSFVGSVLSLMNLMGEY